jgi:hypothetical protein
VFFSDQSFQGTGYRPAYSVPDAAKIDSIERIKEESTHTRIIITIFKGFADVL